MTMTTKVEQDYLDRIQAANSKLEDKFAGKLVVNPDLTRQLVSFQANKSQNSYRWYKYKEGFSAPLMQYIFTRMGLKGQPGLILDPFAGSGTALFEASKIGLDSVGIELLPNCTEIIETRKLISHSDPEELARGIHDFGKQGIWETHGETREFGHLKITAGAFPRDTKHFLERYLYEAGNHPDERLRRLLRFAAFCVLEDISYTRKDGQYLRWDRRSGRTKSKFEKSKIFGFTEAITAKLEQIASDIKQPNELKLFNQANKGELGEIQVFVGSCLYIMSQFEPDSFDGLVTSPPYCNRYDYTRTYALELAMLGITEQEIKDLRQAMLSCTVENREKEDLDQKSLLFSAAQEAWSSQDVLQLILDYLEACAEEGLINNTGIPRMVRNYFRELALVIFESARVLKSGAPLVMVNDNVRYQGAHVPVDLILSNIAQEAGFEVEVIWVLPRGKGNSSQQMGLYGREELRKSVYVWRKA